MTKILNLESDGEDKVGNYLRSKQFQKDFGELVKQETWEKGLPMVYADEKGNIIEHWKDGKINILGHVNDHKKKQHKPKNK